MEGVDRKRRELLRLLEELHSYEPSMSVEHKEQFFSILSQFASTPVEEVEQQYSTALEASASVDVLVKALLARFAPRQ